ncbi:ornithine carbamoyltransferase [Lichenicola sp.]|uniref:ornithine carbamoyltransferase n=1 Tax=Lichenicola sp. TaxID=2804529 RepID=UPI003AFFC907
MTAALDTALLAPEASAAGSQTGAAAGLPSLRHFLDLQDLTASLLREIIDVARSMKQAAMQAKAQGRPAHPDRPFAGLTLGLMLEKPSTRTRVSFEVAMRQLGGDVVVLSPTDMQLGRGETIPDTARVLSRFLDVLVLRTDRPGKLHELVSHATIPVINGLTSASHPVQLLADILTFEEHRGPIAGRIVTWCGDGNNVASSWMEAAIRFGFTLRLATPAERPPDPEVLAWAGRETLSDPTGTGRIELVQDVRAAVAGADCVVTDTWVSMSDDPTENRHTQLEAYRVDASLMNLARPDALFMHCLPAHRGEEVTDEVIEGRWSVVFDEAENRMHAQKALLAWVLGGPRWPGIGGQG